jgi:hypothetical protein
MPKVLRLVPRETFPYTVPGFDGGVVLHYRPLTTEAWERLMVPYFVTENGTRTLPPETVAARMAALFNWTLVRWDGIVGDDGLPLPCDDATKQLFASQFPQTRGDLVSRAQSDPDAAALDAVRPT